MVGKVLEALGRVYSGAAEATGNVLMAGGSAIGKAFKSRSMATTLEHGNIIPFEMKRGYKWAAFGALSAVGIGSGSMSARGVNKESAVDPNSGLPFSDIPGTTGRYISPTRESMANKGIDDMGATGDLVLALNGGRK